MGNLRGSLTQRTSIKDASLKNGGTPSPFTCAALTGVGGRTRRAVRHYVSFHNRAHISISISIAIYIYIYIHIERERAIYLSIYLSIYIEREIDRKRGREKQREIER